MNRIEDIIRLTAEETPWEVVVIGGGATGIGCALDAVSRGYRTLLLEQADFANGTSSRSTKLVHGGVRYLRQGNLALVRESLRERGWLLEHVPHLVQPQPFLIPTFSWWETWFYGIGLWAYDLLAGRRAIHKSQRFGKKAALEKVPTLCADKLAGGVLYWDGQFDDARLCIEAVRTLRDHGALALNYMQVTQLVKEGGKLKRIGVLDRQSGETHTVQGKVFIQATGIFSDTLRKEDAPDSRPIIQASRGSHIVVDGEFLPRKTAVMVPKTSDGRLLFLVPWLNKVIVGTTDVPDGKLCLEPQPTEEEVDFILENAAPYLAKPIRRSDIRSVFSGLRPLVRDPGKGTRTSSISRDHVIEVSDSGFITIAGGKWTTFRQMGEDAIGKAIDVAGLEKRPSGSLSLSFHGGGDLESGEVRRFPAYGSDSRLLEESIKERPELGELLHARLPYTWAEVLWAIRYEWAESVEDVLSRRTRALLLDARAAMEVAPRLAEFMARELGRDGEWAQASVESFVNIAEGYCGPL